VVLLLKFFTWLLIGLSEASRHGHYYTGLLGACTTTPFAFARRDNAFIFSDVNVSVKVGASLAFS